MTLHHLKAWPEYFEPVRVGHKTFEARKNDRGYRVGDILHLREFDEFAGYTGRELHRVVIYILHGPAMGIAPNWCVMSLEDLQVANDRDLAAQRQSQSFTSEQLQ